MSLLLPTGLSVRSYGGDPVTHRHDFTQLVLPISGRLSLDIAGRNGELSPVCAGFVDAGALHTSMSDRPNRSLVVDLVAAEVPAEIGERLAQRPFVPLAPAAAKLIDYMGLLATDGDASPAVAGHWLPLLLDALVRQPARPQSRLAALLAAIGDDPGRPWTTAAMAAHAALSVSRLHELFREELDTTPHAWLAELRLQRVREWLARTNRPIAALALAAGYADQSALTRAMRQATGMTPAAYRRQSRESPSKLP